MDSDYLQQTFQYSDFDIHIHQSPLSLRIQAFHRPSARFLALEVFSDTETAQLTNDFCQTKADLYRILIQSLSKENKSIHFILDSNTNKIIYQCNLRFPIEKTVSFELQLREFELDNENKLRLNLANLQNKLDLLEKLMVQKKITETETDLNRVGLTFSDCFNTNYYNFINENKSIQRNERDSGEVISIWSSRNIKTKGKQCFCLKIDEINENFNFCHLKIGIGKIEYLGNTITNGLGNYSIGNDKIWFDNSEYSIANIFMKGDEIKVIIDFEKKKIRWEKNGEKIIAITMGDIMEEDYQMYAVVSLRFQGETVSFI